jgi:hypothetical protein
MKIYIRRQWNDWRIGEVEFDKISGLRWDFASGGVHAVSPQPFVYGYVDCTEVKGEIGHSCAHGEAPHRIKVCIVKKDNEKETWQKIIDIVGSKPH